MDRSGGSVEAGGAARRLTEHRRHRDRASQVLPGRDGAGRSHRRDDRRSLVQRRSRRQVHADPTSATAATTAVDRSIGSRGCLRTAGRPIATVTRTRRGAGCNRGSERAFGADRTIRCSAMRAAMTRSAIGGDPRPWREGHSGRFDQHGPAGSSSRTRMTRPERSARLLTGVDGRLDVRLRAAAIRGDERAAVKDHATAGGDLDRAAAAAWCTVHPVPREVRVGKTASAPATKRGDVGRPVYGTGQASQDPSPGATSTPQRPVTATTTTTSASRGRDGAAPRTWSA